KCSAGSRGTWFLGCQQALRGESRVDLMNVLALNCGSSSIKFRIFTFERGAEPRRVAHGAVERIGDAATIAFAQDDAASVNVTERVADHAAGLRRVLDWASAVARIDALGHPL